MPLGSNIDRTHPKDSPAVSFRFLSFHACTRAPRSINHGPVVSVVVAVAVVVRG